MWKFWQFACSVFLTYLPDGTNTYGSEGGEFAKKGQCMGLKGGKIMFRRGIPTH